DLAVTDLQGSVSVLLGKGDGSFDMAGSYAAGAIPSCVAVADLNQDGTADLIVANQGTYPFHNSNVTVLLGNGNGTFQPAWPLEAGSVPTAVASATSTAMVFPTSPSPTTWSRERSACSWAMAMAVSSHPTPSPWEMARVP